MSGTSSGFISGAAAGAAIGGETFGPYGAVIGGVIGGIAGLFTGSSSDAQFKQQQEVARYNALMTYNTNMNNANSRFILNGFNAALSLKTAEINAELTQRSALYNANVIKMTTEYNNNLLEYEQELLWDKFDLDKTLLHQQRERERGAIIARQSSSGVILGDEKSTGALVLNSMTQEALDVFIMRHQADINYTNIENKQAQNVWQGNLAIDKVMYEGAMTAYNRTANARLSAASQLMSGAISYNANTNSAINNLTAQSYGLQTNQSTYDRANTAALVNGLFSAANTVIKNYDWQPDGGSLLAEGGYEDNDYVNSWSGGGTYTDYSYGWGE